MVEGIHWIIVWGLVGVSTLLATYLRERWNESWETHANEAVQLTEERE